MSAQPLEAPSRETRERDVTALLRQSDVIAQCLSATIGTAISPLVGIAAISAVGYYRADGDTRSQLPWFNQPGFWLWAIGILAAVALKDTVGGAMPILKKPLDALELVENQVSALVALPVVIPTLMQLLEQASAIGFPVTAWLVPVVYAAQEVPTTAAGPGVLSWLVISVLTTVVFIIVWFTGHVANVLVFLNPIPFVDTVIKSARLALIGAIVASAAWSPSLGIVLCVLVFAISLWLFGWSFRLTHLGTFMAWDILMRRSGTLGNGQPSDLPGFTGASFRDVPPRTYGRLRHRGDGQIEFRYRRFLIFPERALALERRTFAIGKGLLSPTLVQRGEGDDFAVLFRFLPRYRDDEATVARTLGVEDVVDVSIVRGLRALLGDRQAIATEP